MKPGWLICLLGGLIPTRLAVAQVQFQPSTVVDAIHYNYQLAVTDVSDTLFANAAITLKFKIDAPAFTIHLSSLQKNGKGHRVSSVTENNLELHFRHADDQLLISLPINAKAGEVHTYTIRYKGIPADGLVFSKSMYGDRTIFSDNWPNRAHHWIACIDHPLDKASVEFEVTAPEKYAVVSNGVLSSLLKTENKTRTWHWTETAQLPVKVMAVGITVFAEDLLGTSAGVPLSSWVFPKDRRKGVYDYSLTPAILNYFARRIGAYPYKKLANVESKTIYNGMENASAIFYAENSITGTRSNETLLAHEIAHQWFGNSVTEENWAHVWLSEGFATYMTDLYMENKYGRDTLVKMLKDQRKRVFEQTTDKGVVDSITTDYMELLNPNSYDKGSWILHMLRRKLGDDLFWKAITVYYNQFKEKNAQTDHFRLVLEQVSGLDLKSFFRQWLYTPGNPDLVITWKYLPEKSGVDITISQKRRVFNFPLELAAGSSSGSFTVSKPTETFFLPTKLKPAKLIADPNTNLLFRGTVKEL